MRTRYTAGSLRLSGKKCLLLEKLLLLIIWI